MTAADLAVAGAAAAVVVLLRPRPRPRVTADGHGPHAHRHRNRRSAPPAPVQVAVAGIAAVVALVVLGAALGLGAILASLVGRVVVVRAQRRRRLAEVDQAMPDLLDLFRIAVAAGHPVHRCLDEVSGRAPAAVQPPLRRVVERVGRGAPLAAELVAVAGALGTLGPALTDALVAASVTGAPLGPALDRVAATARDRRRRSAEVAARRLPVTLLFPLVCCVLPAFVLLAVVPLLAGSLGSLGR